VTEGERENLGEEGEGDKKDREKGKRKVGRSGSGRPWRWKRMSTKD
jgi:hypothetical protein